MKSFDELLTEISYMDLKRVQRRGEGGRTSPIRNTMVKTDPIGWFSTKSNIAFGFNIHSLDNEDRKWLKSKGVNLTGVFRIVTDRQTNIIKLNLTKGTVAFIDNKYLEDTDKVKFERATAYTKVYVDDGKDNEFGIK